MTGSQNYADIYRLSFSSMELNGVRVIIFYLEDSQDQRRYIAVVI